MPIKKPTKKVATVSTDTLEDIIKSNVDFLSLPIDETIDMDEHVEAVKKIVCTFYKGGNAKGCIGCKQPSEELMLCKEDYIDKISVRPMAVYSTAFDKVEVREKKKFDKPVIGLQCDKCYLSDVCSEFKKMSTCSIEWGFDVAKNEPKSLLNRLIDIQQERISIARAAELMDGGVPDQNLSNEMDRLSGLISLKQDLEADKFSLNIEGKAQNGGGGILKELFKNLGGGNQPAQIEEVKTIDVTAASNPEFVPEKKPRKRGEIE